MDEIYVNDGRRTKHLIGETTLGHIKRSVEVLGRIFIENPLLDIYYCPKFPAIILFWEEIINI